MFAQSYPRYLLRVVNRHEEFYAIIMFFVERHYLRTQGVSQVARVLQTAFSSFHSRRIVCGELLRSEEAKSAALQDGPCKERGWRSFCGEAEGQGDLAFAAIPGMSRLSSCLIFQLMYPPCTHVGWPSLHSCEGTGLL